MLKDNDVFKDIVGSLDKLTQDKEKYAQNYDISEENAQEEIEYYKKYNSLAILGSSSAREYIISQYTKFLTSKSFKLNDKIVNQLINFEDIQKNEIQVVFEMLLSITNMAELIDKYNLPIEITETNIREIAIKEEMNIKRKYESYPSKIKLIAQFAYAKEYGLDCIDSLPFPHQNINEVGIIDKDYIYIIYKRNKYHLKFLHYENATDIEQIQHKITGRSTEPFTMDNPLVTASMLNSNRVTVTGYDVTPEDGDFFTNIRIFNLPDISLVNMWKIYNTLNELLYKFLVLNQHGKGVHIVTGAGMALGKSTLLKSLIKEVPAKWGIGIIDTNNELQAMKSFRKNIYTLIENPKMTIAQLFEGILKMARDVLYVGEINKPEEAAELINTILRLDSGAGATMHSFTAFDVVTNLRNLLMRTPMYNNAEVAEEDISKGLDIIIHVAEHPSQKGRIIIENIVEVQHVEQNVDADVNLTGKKSDKISNLLNLAQIALKKYIYKKCYRYNVLFEYVTDSDNWIPINRPSDWYLKKVNRYLSEEEKEEMNSIFSSCKVV